MPVLAAFIVSKIVKLLQKRWFLQAQACFSSMWPKMFWKWFDRLAIDSCKCNKRFARRTIL